MGELQTLSSKSGNSYKKRDLVISVMRFDPYTGIPKADPDNTPKFTFIGDRCNDLENISVGMTVIVDFDINGRRFEKDGKTEYFTDVRPFRIDVDKRMTGEANIEPETVSSILQTQSEIKKAPFDEKMAPNEGPDDLPF